MKLQACAHADGPCLLVQVQDWRARLQVVQGQHDGLNGQVQTLQGQKTALTGRVEKLQGHHGHLTGRVLHLEEQNATLGEEAASLQQRLDATFLKEHQVSIRPSLHPLHMWLAHTGVSNTCLAARASAYLQACFGTWHSCHQSHLAWCYNLPQSSVCLHVCYHQMSLRVMQEHSIQRRSQGKSPCIDKVC